MPLRLEPHLLLILWAFFVTGRVELLVLLPKGNGKTALMAGLAVFHVLTVPNARCYIGAADLEQAKEMYRFARHFVDSEPDLGRLLLVRASTREIRARRGQGFLRVLASDDSKLGAKKQGFNPTLALVDELHAHDNPNLYVDLRTGVFKRRGRLVVISTAGQDKETVLGELLDAMLAFDLDGGTVERGLEIGPKGLRPSAEGRLTVATSRSGRNALLEWACKPDDDLDDMAAVKLANPASWVTIDGLEDAKEAPGIKPGVFARYRANVWAQPEDTVISEDAWDACCEPGAEIPHDAPVHVVVDYARKSDATAVTEMWRRPDGRTVVKTCVWAIAKRDPAAVQPAAHVLIRDSATIRQSLIRQGIIELGHHRNVVELVFDPHLFDPEILADEWLAEHGEKLEIAEFPQSAVRLVPASKRTYEAINEGRIVHDGDPVLRSHVLAAASKEAGEGWRFSKAASKKRIDALMTIVMGLERVEGDAGGRSVYEQRGLLTV